MSTARAGLLLLLSVLAACTGTGSSSGEPAPRAAQAAPAAAAVHTDPREARLSGAVVALLEREHLRHRRLDDALSRAAFDRYLKALDPGKTFLLKADASALAPHADRIDDELHAGRL